MQNITVQIDEKFKNVSHKWFMINIKDEMFKNDILEYVKKMYKDFDNEMLKSLSSLLKKFKEKGFCWIKLTRLTGPKKNKVALCELITEDNKKINIELNPFKILNCDVLNGTPKSLSLFKESRKWKKPNDGFSDDFDVPLDEEFTEQGYILYKEFIEELKLKGLTLRQWRSNKTDRYTQGIPAYYKKYLKEQEVNKK